MDSTVVNNNAVLQSLLQRADQLTNYSFGGNSSVTVVEPDQYGLTNAAQTSSEVFYSTAASANTAEQSGLRIEEVDEATASRILRSLSPPTLLAQQQHVEADSASSFAGDDAASATSAAGGSSASTAGVRRTAASAVNYSSQIYEDPNGPEIIRRPAAQGPVTYRQNIFVRFLQPPPIPPPGPLIIREVRPPQPPVPPPLIIRQRAPRPATPPPLILRERPPQTPAPIPAQTIIKHLPPIPPPPRSVIVERFSARPAPPRDIIIERWLPYPTGSQGRRIITQRAPLPPPYPAPRNTVIVYEPARVNVIRQVHRLGVQAQNPYEYVQRHGGTLLDPVMLLTHVRQIGVTDDLGPPSSSSSLSQSYQLGGSAEYYVDNAQTVWQPDYEYSAATIENQTVNVTPQPEVYWSHAQEDIRSILQRVGLPLF